MQAIFVTGAASGIGRATAALFAKAGWRVGLADRDEAKLAETAAALGGPHSTHVMDVRDVGAWESELASFVIAAGRLDVMFNNAGIAAGGPFGEIDIDTPLLDAVVGKGTARTWMPSAAHSPSSASVSPRTANFVAE